MSNCNATYVCCAARRWLRLGGLAVLLCFVLPTTAFAAASGPSDEGSPTCTQCHPTEATAWGDSPHAHALETIEAGFEDDSECLSCHTTEYDASAHTYAHAGVTCEACHGEYVQDHPQSGVMNLQVDSSSCQNCHNTTAGEWQATAHAEAGVQCISCHQPHSQKTRLDNAALCESCHREEPVDWVHQHADVDCIDCHLLSDSDMASDVQVSGPGAAPDHNFRLAVEACVECHSDTVHGGAVKATDIECAQASVMVDRARELAMELEDAKQANRNLQAMSVVSLGFGLGTGGVLGVLFVLFVAFIAQGRSKR